MGLDEEKQSKLINNPCWDKKNQKEKKALDIIEYNAFYIWKW